MANNTQGVVLQGSRQSPKQTGSTINTTGSTGSIKQTVIQQPPKQTLIIRSNQPTNVQLRNQPTAQLRTVSQQVIVQGNQTTNQMVNQGNKIIQIPNSHANAVYRPVIRTISQGSNPSQQGRCLYEKKINRFELSKDLIGSFSNAELSIKILQKTTRRLRN